MDSDDNVVQIEGFPIGQDGELTVSAQPLPELDKCALLTISGDLDYDRGVLTEAAIKAIGAGFINLIFVNQAFGRFEHSVRHLIPVLKVLRPLRGKIALVSQIKRYLQDSTYDTVFVLAETVSEAASKLPEFALPWKDPANEADSPAR